MKIPFLIVTITLPLGLFAQGPNTNINPLLQSQIQNVNYHNQIDENNNSLGNASGINNEINPIQTNIGKFQQANPPAQVQEQKSSGSIFGSGKNDNHKLCTDCDELKQAITASHASSGGRHHKKSLGMKHSLKNFSGRIKMKKIFAHKYKVKTNYAMCFNWH